MTQEAIPITEEVVLRGDVNTHVRLINLNRPRQLNVISPWYVSLLSESLEQWEKDDNVELVIFKGNGRAYSAGGDLKVFYDGRDSSNDDACLEVVHRMYWLCYHNHTYKKTQVLLYCPPGGSCSWILNGRRCITNGPIEVLSSHRRNGARLNGKELVSVGLATHYVPSEKLPELEKCLIDLNSREEHAVKSVIEEFSLDCFSKESVEEIFESL
ncbi:hypothetical protein MKW98_025150, partial [Papaver atlanticum]